MYMILRCPNGLKYKVFTALVVTYASRFKILGVFLVD